MRTITTYSGLEVDPLNVTPEFVNINDIAHALALCNRFAGHTRWPMSVAQHSIGVSILSESPGSKIALQGLLHDAAEAYLGDMTKWLKESPEMFAYRAAEDRALAAVLEKYGLKLPLHETVEWADRLMVRFEFEISFGRGQVVPGYGELTTGERRRIAELLDSGLWRPCMSWMEAEANFLTRFRDILR